MYAKIYRYRKHEVKMTQTNGILNDLNNEQYKAVTETDGAVLVLAGAGSGKTRVLTRRIAYIIDQGLARPNQILAITFTNKAAGQIKERVYELVGPDYKGGFFWLGTIHSVCLKMLRQYPAQAGYRSNFLVYDTEDRKSVIKNCMKELNISDNVFKVSFVSAEIGRAKDSLIDPKKYQSMHAYDFQLKVIGTIYELYQKKLMEYNAMDFDDIIFNTYYLFKNNEDILGHFQNIFKYIMIDEFQDTNIAQYKIFAMLSMKNRNLFVVGDDDQSIYSFRGANIKNILNFEKDFPDSKVIKLETNYRSFANILKAANAVIKNNLGRTDKCLKTSRDDGEKITVYKAYNELNEAIYVASEISKSINSGEHVHKDFAVLYRTNAQSRTFERVFRERGLSYRIFGGLSFFSRQEVKDVLAYMRLTFSTQDDASLFRIINQPKRGIGDTTIKRVQNIAAEENMTAFDVIRHADHFSDLSSAKEKLLAFADIIEEMQKYNEAGKLDTLYDIILQLTKIDEHYKTEDEENGRERVENIKELKSAIVTMQQSYEEDYGQLLTLTAFLENVTLATDADKDDKADDFVSIMTLHSAKGLEFKVVFLVGMEEGLFPSIQSVTEDPDNMEEERRLCYVGITRAMDKLYCIHAEERTKFGKTQPCEESRFLKEIPALLVSGARMKQKQPYYASDRNTFTPTDLSALVTRGGKKIDIPGLTSRNDGPMKKEDYSIGDRVVHKKYGEGNIKDLYDDGGMDIVEVNFDLAGVKRLVMEFAKLQKI